MKSTEMLSPLTVTAALTVSGVSDSSVVVNRILSIIDAVRDLSECCPEASLRILDELGHRRTHRVAAVTPAELADPLSADGVCRELGVEIPDRLIRHPDVGRDQPAQRALALPIPREAVAGRRNDSGPRRGHPPLRL